MYVNGHRKVSHPHNIMVSRNSLALFKETISLLKQLFCNQLGVDRRAKANFPKGVLKISPNQ